MYYVNYFKKAKRKSKILQTISFKFLELGVCVPNLCRNGGTCMALPGQSNSFICICADGFSGEICETGKETINYFL